MVEVTTYNTLLKGIVGSTAYGLAGPDSDIDRLGIFACNTKDLFKLEPPTQSVVRTNPDVTMHEALKAVKLILSCNPTAMEILWLPKKFYEKTSSLGNQLILFRHAFLSAERVKGAYLGYATQQFKRLLQRGDGKFDSDTGNRTAKHARHLKRLVTQGYHLYTEGELIIEVENPQSYHDFGDMVAANPESVIPFMTEAEEKFNSTATCLQSEPNKRVAELWLLDVRKAFY